MQLTLRQQGSRFGDRDRHQEAPGRQSVRRSPPSLHEADGRSVCCITGIENFQLDPAELSETLQHVCASSSAHSLLPNSTPKQPHPEVTVQGATEMFAVDIANRLQATRRLRSPSCSSPEAYRLAGSRPCRSLRTRRDDDHARSARVRLLYTVRPSLDEAPDLHTHADLCLRTA